MRKKYSIALMAAAAVAGTIISIQVLRSPIKPQVKETSNKTTLVLASDYQKRPMMQVDFDGEGNIIVQPSDIKPKEEIVQVAEAKNDKVYAAKVNEPKKEAGLSRGGSISISLPKKALTNKSTSQSSKSGQTSKTVSAVNYNEKELFYRLVSAEAAGEPFEGMLAVATVIMNRVKSPNYPNTIAGVIMDKNWGYQFSPVADGRINEPASAEAKRAVDMVLSGYRSFGAEVLYYLNPKKATNSWIPKSKAYFKTIGKHDFYY
jgi:spore germination cell wall hydrolase CwlJ-like protein